MHPMGSLMGFVTAAGTVKFRPGVHWRETFCHCELNGTHKEPERWVSLRSRVYFPFF